MNWFPRLVARGHFGRVDPPPFTYDLTSNEYFQAAKKKGGLRNLIRLRGFEELQEEAELDNSAALVLSSRTRFPAAWSAKASWSGSGMSHVEELPNIFGGRFPGLAYYDNGVAANFESSFEIEAQQPFCVRAFLFEPKDVTDEEKADLEAAGLDPRPIWSINFDNWLFRIIDGTFEISRFSSNWSQAKQNQLDDLLDIADPTSEEQEQIDNLVGPRRTEAGGVSFPNAIYDIHQTLDLGKPVEKQAGKYYELYFHPEPRGRLNVTLAGGKPQSVEVPEIIASRELGTIYGSTPLLISTGGQTFLWQTGHNVFRPTGSLTIGPFKTAYWADSLGEALLKAIKDVSLPGTSVTIEHIVHNSIWFSFKITVSTSDSRFSPFVYGATADLSGGTRTGSDEIVYDSSSDEARELTGLPPIEDVSPSCEGATGAAIKTQRWKMRIQDPWGTALVSLTEDNNFEALENRIVDFSAGATLDGQQSILTRGIVMGAQLNDVGRIRYDTGTGVLQTLRRWLCLGKTKLNLDIADAVAILDEDKMRDAPIGDDMRLGAYLRQLLLNGGWSIAEIAGISATAGRVLPRAGLGEAPCIRPKRGQSRGGFIRQLIETYGLGWSLRMGANGVWQFFGPSATIKTINGHVCHFSTDVARNNRYTWPGRFAIRGPIDHIRDTSDFFNHFRVEGWIDPTTGQRISDEYTIQESIRKSSVWASLKYIGRLKAYDTIRDEGLRTASDLQYALRTLVLLYGRSCRFVQFETYFHIGLLPGDRITVDGLLCEIVRIPGGSLLKDEMTIVAMELE